MRGYSDDICTSLYIICNTPTKKSNFGKDQDHYALYGISTDHNRIWAGVHIMIRCISVIIAVMMCVVCIGPASASSIVDDLKQNIPLTYDNMRDYLRAHVGAGYIDMTTQIDQTIIWNPREKCHNKDHTHRQIMDDIAMKQYYKMSYKCLDQQGEMWMISVKSKIALNRGIFSDYDRCSSPCQEWDYTCTYDLRNICDDDLRRLYNYFIAVDQQLGATNVISMVRIAENIGSGSLELVTAIGAISAAITTTGSKIPYIGTAILGAGGTIYAVSSVAKEIMWQDAVANQCISIADSYRT